MNKEQVLGRLEKAWNLFQQSYAGLTESRLLEPGVSGSWSVRDILAHVTTWEEEALKYLPVILENGKPPRYSVTHGGIDAFNAQMTGRKKDLPLSEVLQQLEATHRQLVNLVRNTSDGEFTRETRFRRRLRADTYGHYPKHAEAILRWRERGERESG
jgi:hypothetical protein